MILSSNHVLINVLITCFRRRLYNISFYIIKHDESLKWKKGKTYFHCFLQFSSLKVCFKMKKLQNLSYNQTKNVQFSQLFIMFSKPFHTFCINFIILQNKKLSNLCSYWSFHDVLVWKYVSFLQIFVENTTSR